MLVHHSLLEQLQDKKMPIYQRMFNDILILNRNSCFFDA